MAHDEERVQLELNVTLFGSGTPVPAKSVERGPLGTGGDRFVMSFQETGSMSLGAPTSSTSTALSERGAAFSAARLDRDLRRHHAQRRVPFDSRAMRAPQGLSGRAPARQLHFPRAHPLSRRKRVVTVRGRTSGEVERAA